MNRKHYFVMVSALLAGAALGTFGSRAFGSAPTPVGSPTGRIHGCYGADHGFVRVVRDVAECGSSEGRLTWNVEGPAGPPGPVGQRGPAGPPGAMGQAGTRGAAPSVGAWPPPPAAISWDRR